MSDDRHTASPGYAIGRLRRALATATTHTDPDTRDRARARAERWRAVLDGIEGGTLTPGRRTPVAEAPPWVTLEVAHGGFATGRFLAEGDLAEHEEDRLTTLPDGVPGQTPRDQLNAWYVSDAGQGELVAAIREGRLRIAVPEEGALPVAAWLMDQGHESAALDLIATLRPWMHRLRFYPHLRPTAQPSGAVVRVADVAEAIEALDAVRPPPQVAAMNETLRIWNPLYDRLVALWLQTVSGDPPTLQRDPDPNHEVPVVVGGWPAQRWPEDWADQRAALLADLKTARSAFDRCGRPDHPKHPMAVLRTALQRCPTDSSALSGRDVGRIRRALAGTIARHGLPGSEQRDTLRRTQAATAARPTHAEIAAVVSRRLSAYPEDGGLPDLDPIRAPTRPDDSEVVPAGTPIPPHLVDKAARALEAPVADLVERGLIGSSEVLAAVLPQITSQVAAASIADPGLRALYGQIYAAFRRRRSLLLLDLERQVQLDELPWVSALAPFRATGRSTGRSARATARQTLEEVATLALTGFPETLLPNPLVREIAALAEDAGVALPLVEEVAADIFMGVFTGKWAASAQIAATLLEGTLYARYYDLPDPTSSALRPTSPSPTPDRNRPRAHNDFSTLCRNRAREADAGGSSAVAKNGAILEQSQILTTHNLAALTEALDLKGTLPAVAPDAAERALRWVVRTLSRPPDAYRARLQGVKNAAYAWRQAIFWLSWIALDGQYEALAQLRSAVAAADPRWADRFDPALSGLELVVGGGRFEADGYGAGRRDARRVIGWSVGKHWLLP